MVCFRHWASRLWGCVSTEKGPKSQDAESTFMSIPVPRLSWVRKVAGLIPVMSVAK